MNKYIHATSAALLGIPLMVIAQDVPDAGLDRFENLLSRAKDRPLHSEYTAAAVYSSKTRFVAYNDRDMDWAFNAAMRLWVANQHDYLLLRWHEEQSSLKRTMICTLFLCDKINVVRGRVHGQRFRFDSNRYREEESEARRQEIEYVMQNAPRLARIILAAMEPTLSDTRISGFKYTANLSVIEHRDLIDAVDELLRK